MSKSIAKVNYIKEDIYYLKGSNGNKQGRNTNFLNIATLIAFIPLEKLLQF